MSHCTGEDCHICGDGPVVAVADKVLSKKPKQMRNSVTITVNGESVTINSRQRIGQLICNVARELNFIDPFSMPDDQFLYELKNWNEEE